MTDIPAIGRLQERIRAAASTAQALRIRGSGTKDFYGEAPIGEPLDVRECSGIVAYAPGELVVTARAGTPLAQIEAALAEHDQMLAFEPPHHGADATLGGIVATGFSGPRRAQAGAVRDFVLGVRIIDGTGEALAFGGQVIKNVAGFDVSRLMTGALGTLGVLTEVSLKCLPRPRSETTRAVSCSGADAIRLMNSWGGQPLPISGTCHVDGRLHVRLSGSAAAIGSALPVIGGDAADGEGFWTSLRDQTHPFFAAATDGDATLWRLSVRSTAPWTDAGESVLVEWGGALRWVVCAASASASSLRSWAAAQGGHATLYRGPDKTAGVFAPLPPPMMALHRRLKDVFDPQRVLNRGRQYADL
jgi:glycolate oxidase FAD binding subunit